MGTCMWLGGMPGAPTIGGGLLQAWLCSCRRINISCSAFLQDMNGTKKGREPAPVHNICSTRPPCNPRSSCLECCIFCEARSSLVDARWSSGEKGLLTPKVVLIVRRQLYSRTTGCKMRSKIHSSLRRNKFLKGGEFWLSAHTHNTGSSTRNSMQEPNNNHKGQ